MHRSKPQSWLPLHRHAAASPSQPLGLPQPPVPSARTARLARQTPTNNCMEENQTIPKTDENKHLCRRRGRPCPASGPAAPRPAAGGPGPGSQSARQSRWLPDKEGRWGAGKYERGGIVGHAGKGRVAQPCINTQRQHKSMRAWPADGKAHKHNFIMHARPSEHTCTRPTMASRRRSTSDSRIASAAGTPRLLTSTCRGEGARGCPALLKR